MIKLEGADCCYRSLFQGGIYSGFSRIDELATSIGLKESTYVYFIVNKSLPNNIIDEVDDFIVPNFGLDGLYPGFDHIGFIGKFEYVIIVDSNNFFNLLNNEVIYFRSGNSDLRNDMISVIKILERDKKLNIILE